MIPQVESDAAYRVLSKTLYPMSNAPLHVLCNTNKKVVTSAAEVEASSLFLAAQKACSLRVTLTELGYPQPSKGV